MSKKLLRKRAYNIQDFKSATRIERMRMYLVEPDQFALNDRDDRYFQLLRQAYPIICQGLPKAETKEMIEDLKGSAYRESVVKIIRDAQELFGPFEEVDKRVQRGTIREKLKRLAHLSEEKDDLEEARACYEALIKLDRLDKDDPIEEVPNELPMPRFTDDTAALEQFEEAEVDDD